ncbi:uncharacterized protein BDR25DRAFT_349748 [Lindgomyces ingoldianus]|uniref:Uncharacterized protein n=1 Tax=Lindgomyces ingoldianus TaxID=673940 RepID=A0ACB6RED2_9PLEO|nr:uncharacterized protein BDR25DRAFT_349748 [Lindgomyces ingoldianus]KAF2476675.1 hypothetical protein BDR25DRAFT_349748 [Lindgomyces ingoldianus]
MDSHEQGASPSLVPSFRLQGDVGFPPDFWITHDCGTCYLLTSEPRKLNLFISAVNFTSPRKGSTTRLIQANLDTNLMKWYLNLRSQSMAMVTATGIPTPRPVHVHGTDFEQLVAEAMSIRLGKPGAFLSRNHTDKSSVQLIYVDTAVTSIYKSFRSHPKDKFNPAADFIKSCIGYTLYYYFHSSLAEVNREIFNGRIQEDLEEWIRCVLNFLDAVREYGKITTTSASEPNEDWTIKLRAPWESIPPHQIPFTIRHYRWACVPKLAGYKASRKFRKHRISLKYSSFNSNHTSPIVAERALERASEHSKNVTQQAATRSELMNQALHGLHSAVGGATGFCITFQGGTLEFSNNPGYPSPSKNQSTYALHTAVGNNQQGTGNAPAVLAQQWRDENMASKTTLGFGHSENTFQGNDEDVLEALYAKQSN